MAVSATRFVSAGLYTPYHTLGRGGSNGLVGSLSVDAEATGDSGGGSVTVALNMGRQEFGFPILWVPTVIAIRDNLAAAENVALIYDSTNNRRLAASFHEVVVGLRSGATNTALMSNVSIPVEGDAVAPAGIFAAIWPTNTDTKSYHLHMFGPVFDLQVIAKQGEIDLLAAGVR